MIKGFYAAASGMIVGLKRQVALTHNIDNIDTPGFKQVLVAMDDYLQTAVVPPAKYGKGPELPASLESIGVTNQLRWVGNLGLGVQTEPEFTDYSPGSFMVTNETLDFAIQGDGFFRVTTPDGERYTRDGRFMRDTNKNLVTVDGYFVLSKDGSKITIPDGAIEVDLDGMIKVDTEDVAQIGLAGFKDPETELVRDKPNLFIAAGGITKDTDNGQIHQGTLESSNINTAQLVTQMMATARSYEASQKLVSAQDALLGKAIASLGRA